MHLHWPQLTYMVLALLGLGIDLAKDGEPKGNHCFWTSLVAIVFTVFLLAKGGFFG